jgi:uncharacterized membrane protein YhaH (DUF805 family)
MGFFESIGNGFSNYFTFSGRALRSEFWYWHLFIFIFNIPLAIFGPFIPILNLLYLVIFFPTLSVTIRRLHDTNHSGWWQLLQIIPIIGFLALIYWFTKAGDISDNRFGSPPYGSKSNNSAAAQAARSRQEPSPASSSNDTNPSAAKPSEPSPSAESSRQNDQPDTNTSKPRPTKPEDIFFDNRKPPSKKSTPEKPVIKEPEQKTAPKDSSLDDDIFFDNRLKK